MTLLQGLSCCRIPRALRLVDSPWRCLCVVLPVYGVRCHAARCLVHAFLFSVVGCIALSYFRLPWPGFLLGASCGGAVGCLSKRLPLCAFPRRCRWVPLLLCFRILCSLVVVSLSLSLPLGGFRHVQVGQAPSLRCLRAALLCFRLRSLGLSVGVIPRSPCWVPCLVWPVGDVLWSDVRYMSRVCCCSPCAAMLWGGTPCIDPGCSSADRL